MLYPTEVDLKEPSNILAFVKLGKSGKNNKKVAVSSALIGISRCGCAHMPGGNPSFTVNLSRIPTSSGWMDLPDPP